MWALRAPPDSSLDGLRYKIDFMSSNNERPRWFLNRMRFLCFYFDGYCSLFLG